MKIITDIICKAQVLLDVSLDLQTGFKEKLTDLQIVFLHVIRYIVSVYKVINFKQAAVITLIL